MATTIKKQIGSATRYVFKFDAPPTMTELRKAIGDIAVEEREVRLSKVTNEGNTVTVQSPVRFVFIVEGETETDVPPA